MPYEKFSRKKYTNNIAFKSGSRFIDTGDLGEAFCRISKFNGQLAGTNVVILKNGLTLIYFGSGSRLITAMVVPPEQIIRIMQHAETFDLAPTPSGIPVWLLRKGAENSKEAFAQNNDSYSFQRVPNTRRYIY